MHSIQKLLSLLVSFVLCSSLSAQPPEGKIETDRPDQTESPFIVPKNYFQFEFGLNLEKDKVLGISTTTFVLPTGLLKYGINENVEFRLELQSFTSRRRNDLIKKSTLLLEPVEVGFKAKLWEEKGALPKTSFIIHTAVPKLSSRQYSHLSAAPNFRFVMQNTLSDNWAVGYNSGMEWDGESTIPTYTYTFAPGFTINEKWAGYFEVFGFINKEKTPQHSVDGGLYYFPSNNVKFDISAGFGLTKNTPDFYVAVGGSVRFRR